jgi:hypothetical protein
MTASVLASPPRQTTGSELEQDIMAVGRYGKSPTHDPETWVPVSRLREALGSFRRKA